MTALPADAEPLMTPGEAARVLGVHPETVRLWARRGKLGYIRIGPNGHRRYRRGEVLALAVARLRDAS